MADQLERLKAALAGQYDVERLLGEGGMACVYLARDLRLDRRVAVKLLKPDLSATIGAERFLREIKVAAQLQHPNILGLYDSGAADGLFYYVMPFIEGESLRDRLDREHQLPIEDALRIVREAAGALQFAHDQGIIHRDIKPENILLNNGHALVADFGIAKAVEDAGQKLTQTGMAIGTPHYMSPEQSLGSAIDGRADQYALGCVLFEILVGQPPFTGPNAMAILARHSLEQVPSMQVVRSSVPDAVEDAVFRALEKTPADRFANMTEFAEALAEAEAEASLHRTQARRTATQTSVLARRPTLRTMRPTSAESAAFELAAQRAATKRKWIFGALAAVTVLIGGVVGRQFLGSGTRAPRTALAGPDARRVAVLYFKSEGDSLRYLADGLTEGLIGELARVQELEVISRNGVAQFRGQALTRDSIAKVLQVGMLVEGDIKQEGNRIRGTVRLVDAASGVELDARSFEQPADAFLSLRDSLAKNATEFIRKNLGTELRLRKQRVSTASADAWLLLQRAEAARKDAEAAVATGDTVVAPARFGAADSLARLASEADPQWNAPAVFRGFIRYRQSRIAINNPTLAKRLIDEGAGFADAALGRDNVDPDALELRGSLRYWRWLMRFDEGAAAKTLLARAQADLVSSTELSPTQAGAWAVLSHLYYQTAGISDVILAARRAYEADAYVENAPAVLNRLFLASYDSEQVVDAMRWCAEGRRRMPNDARFVMCQLYLMTMRSQNPDVPTAWAAASSGAIRSDVTTGSPEFRVREARMLVAAVLARAGLKDSARSVAQSALAGADIDPTKSLYDLQAFVLLLAGDNAAAITALKTYLAANPDRVRDFATNPGWRFLPLAGEPAFKEAVRER